MQNAFREWLVRTRAGEILGPFTQQELLDELRRKSFSGDDEIATSQGRWMSAQRLLHRDQEEVTHTATATSSTHTQSSITPTTGSHSFGRNGQAPLARSLNEELTPTPDFSSHASRYGEVEVSIVSDPQSASFGVGTKKGPSLLIAVVAVGALLGILLIVRAPSKPDNSVTVAAPGHMKAESPFVREIYALIHAGRSQEALKQLTKYHDKTAVKGEWEYLIPYAALLILEKESLPRAEKLLDQILSSEAPVEIKAKAHHWLGYLLLSQEEGDLGESHFLEALQLNPRDAATRFNLGRAYLKQERFSQALDYLQLAELESPDLWIIHVYKGMAKSSLNNMEEARASFKVAVERSPDRWLSYICYALFLVGVNEMDQAQSVLRKMMTRDPHYEIQSPAPFGFYQDKVNYADYLSAFNRIMDRTAGEDRDIGKIYINYLNKGYSSSDFKRLEALADKGSINARVIAMKIGLEREASTAEIKTLLLRMPENLSSFGYYAYVLRGEAKARLGMVKEAEQDFQKALVLEPKGAITYWALLSLFRHTDRKAEALTELRHLLTFHPDYIPALLIQ